MSFSGYNHHQQNAYGYDPSSQIQPYDQSYSYQSYYAYNHQYQYAYFPSHAYTIPDTHQPNLQFQPEPAPVHPPGVNPTAPEPAPPRAIQAPREYLAVLPLALLGFSLDKRPILE